MSEGTEIEMDLKLSIFWRQSLSPPILANPALGIMSSYLQQPATTCNNNLKQAQAMIQPALGVHVRYTQITSSKVNVKIQSLILI